MSDEQKRNQRRGLVDHKPVKISSSFTAGRPKAALLFGSSFLFLVLLVALSVAFSVVDYKYLS